MIGQVIVVVIVALVIAGLLAPAEALSWWRRGQLGERGIEWPELQEAFARPGDEADDPVPAELPPEADHYLVYLSGIGISSPDQLPVMEIPMIDRLRERLGGTEVIWQIYPYSVENTALTQGRRFSLLWRRLATWKFEKTRLRSLGFLINVRNAFQVFVSADQRYGPVFNLAIAQQIAAALIRSGYRPEHRRPVTLLGWSGGAQIAAGATWYLAALGMDVRIISLAGTLSSDPGLDRAKKIWHMSGDADHAPVLGAILSARRWVFFRNSSWNRAKRDGRLEFVSMGALKHTGPGGYFSSAPLPDDDRQPQEITADHLLAVLRDAGLAFDRRLV